MPSHTLPDLRQRIYECIIDSRGPLPERVMRIISGNIALLIKWSCGPDIGISTVTIPIVDIRKNETLKAQQTKFIVHNGFGWIKVIVDARVSRDRQVEGDNVIVSLTQKADAHLSNVS